VGGGLGLLGLPSSFLFGALLAGLVAALLNKRARLELPHYSFNAAQAVTGVTLGAYLRSSSLTALAHDWLPVLLVGAATLGLSLLAAWALARLTSLDPVTAALGSVAGGASGIVSMADELGADDRLVAFMQYARVLVVVLLTPLIAALAFPGSGGGAGAPATPVIGHASWWAITLACAAGGSLLARLARIPVPTLLGPMIVAGAITLAAPGGTLEVPALLRETGFAVIGLQVGLRFTLDTVRQVGRLLVPVLMSVLAIMAGCFLLALALTATTKATLLDSYLATTPGGLYAVLATAFGAGADTTFIVAVQTLRLLVMILLAPLAVRGLARRQPGRSKELV
jgi:uncharacterized protein